MHGDFDHACELLNSTDWNSLFSSGDINNCWSSWKARFLEVIAAMHIADYVVISQEFTMVDETSDPSNSKAGCCIQKDQKVQEPSIYQKYRAARNKVLSGSYTIK